MNRISFCILLSLLVAGSAAGQDDHYWTQQFGAVSTSMGGAVVAGVRDNSAIYYNPGAQAFIDNPNLSVDANLYRLDRVKIKNGAGDNVNLNSSQMSIYPQIVSGLINLFRVPNLRMGYAILTRNYNNVLMNTRFTNRDLDQNPDPGTEFIGAFDYANQLNEQWFGASVSYQVNKKHGFGLSFFGSYRGQTYGVSNYIREVRYEDSVARFTTLNIEENIKYGTFVMLAKLGWAFESKHWNVGITLTTPGIWFYGTGSIQREVSLYSATDQPGDTAISFIVLDRKPYVKTRYKHPFSFAAGVEYHTASTRIAFTAEYFTGIKSYSLMECEADPLVYPPWIKDSADVREYLKGYLNVNNKAKPVLNVALGISQDLSKSFTLMAGARTDFSSFAKPEGADILLHSAGEWDLYNVSTGLSYHTKKQSITLGFTYTFSPRLSIDPYAIVNPYTSTGQRSTVFSQTFGLVLGYTHYIKN